MVDEFDWFRPDDLTELFKALNQLASNPVLVGGQSLTFWLDFYSIPVPEITTIYLTQDADILGTISDAKVASKALGGLVRIPQSNDNTPNAAVVTYKTKDGRKLFIDFLGCLIGLNNEEIAKTAVRIDHVSYGLINILHPTLVLKSRISNLSVLKSKRTGNGIAQARLAVTACRAFFIEYALQLPETDRDEYLMERSRW